VWSLVVRQPNVRVGTVPEGVASEVWVAPQVSARRKANARGEEHVEIKPAELNVIPDARVRTLDELAAEHGDNLRVATDSESIHVALTGSHVRVSG
jgi:oxalate---CoA ligase